MTTDAYATARYEVDCPECGETVDVDHDPSGETVECDHCEEILFVIETR